MRSFLKSEFIILKSMQSTNRNTVTKKQIQEHRHLKIYPNLKYISQQDNLESVSTYHKGLSSFLKKIMVRWAKHAIQILIEFLYLNKMMTTAIYKAIVTWILDSFWLMFSSWVNILCQFSQENVITAAVTNCCLSLTASLRYWKVVSLLKFVNIL